MLTSITTSKQSKYFTTFYNDILKYVFLTISVELENYVIIPIRCVKADLHCTTLTHSTSLRQVHDMSWDQLNVYDIFFYKIKYAQVCTRIYGAEKF